MVLTAAIATPSILFPPVISKEHCLKQKKSFICYPKNVSCRPIALRPLCVRFQTNERKSCITHGLRMKRAPMTFAASLSATCAAGQTQTVIDNVSTITNAPTNVKLDNNGGNIRPPELDNNGGNIPPRGNGSGGGGGGGGGGHWSGGFFLFGFLAFLSFLKDQESEGEYQN